MAFNSLAFVCVLPLFVLLYWCLPARPRLWATLVASYAFYGVWDYRFLALIWISTAVDYVVGLRLDALRNAAMRRCCLLVSVAVNIGLLGVFKYFHFFAESLQTLAAGLGMRVDPVTLEIVLPVGISFYTFQTLSYTIDVYRRDQAPERDWLRFATYVAYFPQLVAGPIVRAKDLLPQLTGEQRFDGGQFEEGFARIVCGFFKKLVIADTIAIVVDPLFEFPGGYGTLNTLLLVCLFAVQIYADFSGYTDIAIGVSLWLGIRLPENFKSPFFSRSMSEFWRRWHCTLSNWLRDYVYIPLGGSRHGAIRTAISLLTTMTLGGLWHGANWTFLIWGVIHGGILVIERQFRQWHKPSHRVGAATRNLLSLPSSVVGPAYVVGVFVMTGVLFRSESLSQSLEIFQRIVAMEGLSASALHNRVPLLKALGLAAIFMAAEGIQEVPPIREWLQARSFWRPTVAALALWAIALFGTYGGNAFVYFQF
ncbi:MAG: MBOAT family O-acyltransferase [Planctomycetota bacterium]